AFTPLLILEGKISWLLRPLPIVLIVAILFSLFESFCLLPNHLHHLLPRRDLFEDRRAVEWLRNAYARTIAIVLKGRYL
ncbi:MAG: hypothetical protein ABEN55_20640, partial [Bradymonadaceae bacterium]